MTTTNNVLLIGSGGREHALAWKLVQSPLLAQLFVAPGNGGTQAIAKNIDIAADDISGLVEFAKTHDIGLTVVGPDNPLALGIVDAFLASGLRIFGPTKASARIESSKAFAKELMTKRRVPTAKYRVFTDREAIIEYARHSKYPLVIKASGLALGKGVYICENFTDAERAVEEMMVNQIFGEAGTLLVVEEFLAGQEISIHAFCDGKTAVLFPAAQDHKRIRDNDEGPNTGGMGAFAPVPWVTPELIKQVETRVLRPTLAGLDAQGSPFKGCLYPGLIVTSGGVRVLEFNARFGDPETQVYMPLLQTDLLQILLACIDGQLASALIEWSSQTAVCVVIASGGYPGKYQTGLPIQGIDQAEKLPDVTVFHAGTTFVDGQYLTAGGRVLAITATGDTLASAKQKAYAAVQLISFKGMQYRTDISDKPAPSLS